MKNTVLMMCMLGWMSAASAHDAWVDERGPAHAVRYGHADKVEAYDTKKVVAVNAWDARGVEVTTSTRVGDDGVRIEAPAAALIALDFDNGYWCKVDGKSRNVSKTEVPGATDGSRSLKFGKTVLAWNAALTRPLGRTLEVVPVSAAAPVAGQPLTLVVLFEGKPLAGAKVNTGGTHYDKPLLTDDKGQVTVPVQPGLNIVGVGHSLPHDGPQADKLNMAANLRFTVR